MMHARASLVVPVVESDGVYGGGIAAEVPRDRRDVVADEPDIGVVGGPRVTGEVVVSETGLVRRAGLARDLREHRAREHLRAEDRGNVLGLDLVDEARDVLRRRLRE